MPAMIASSFTLPLFLLLPFMTCHPSTGTSAAFQTLSKASLHSERLELFDRTASDDFIDVYKGDGKLVLRYRGLNQTLEFKTSPADRALQVQASYSQQAGENDIYQSSYERIFGVYKLPLAYCIAFIKSSEPANNFLGGDYGVRSIKEISYVVIPSASSSLTVPGNSDSFSHQSESAKQKEAITLMQHTFSRHSFYYSSRLFDVTRNLQSNSFQHSAAVSESERHDRVSILFMSIAVIYQIMSLCSIFLGSVFDINVLTGISQALSYDA